MDIPTEDYQVLNVNLKAAFLIAQAVGRIMIKQRRGKMINISSVRSLPGIRSGYVAYCSGTGGLNRLTKKLATEWVKYNMNVNAIAPTFIRTESVWPALLPQHWGE